MRAEEGFTSMELLVVSVILAPQTAQVMQSCLAA